MYGCVHAQVLQAPPYGWSILWYRLPTHALHGPPGVPTQEARQPVCPQVCTQPRLGWQVELSSRHVCPGSWWIQVWLKRPHEDSFCLVLVPSLLPKDQHQTTWVDIVAPFCDLEFVLVTTRSLRLLFVPSGCTASRSTPWPTSCSCRQPPASRVPSRPSARASRREDQDHCEKGRVTCMSEPFRCLLPSLKTVFFCFSLAFKKKKRKGK